MKREKRVRFYDAQWEAIRAERLKALVALRAQRKPPAEQDCIKCREPYPVQEPYFRPPQSAGHSFGRLCCFCAHDFDIRINRAKADGQPVEPIIEERRALILRANTQARKERVEALKRTARATAGPRAKCHKCDFPWPIAEAHAKRFWRLDRGTRRHCLPCDWQRDSERRQTSG